MRVTWALGRGEAPGEYSMVGCGGRHPMETAQKDMEGEAVKVERPKPARLTEEETLKRMESFEERKEKFVASVRKGKN
jgi:hypothetical protein